MRPLTTLAMVGFLLGVGSAPAAEAEKHYTTLPLENLIDARVVELDATETDIGRPRNVLTTGAGRARFVSQPAHMTLSFHRPVKLAGARVMFSHSSAPFLWTIDCADSQADLNAGEGSYMELITNRKVRSEVADEAVWAPHSARVWRLTYREEQGDRFCHLDRFELLCLEDEYLGIIGGTGAIETLRLVATDGQPIESPLILPGHRCRLIRVEGLGRGGSSFDLTGVARLEPARADILRVIDGEIIVPADPGRTLLRAELGRLCSEPIQVFVRPVIDLEVLAIEREPRYPRYFPHWEPFTIDEGFAKVQMTFATGLDRGQTPETQRWPYPGEKVTFSAVLFNRGNRPATNGRLRWFIDGSESGPVDVPEIGPGETLRIPANWSWKPDRHEIGVIVDCPRDAEESNNRLTRATDALELTFEVEEGYRVRFNARTDQVERPAADSIASWIHHHLDRFNEMFESKQCKTRITAGRLAYVPDNAPPIDDNLIVTFDGRFPERFRARDKDWRLGGSGYYRPESDIDFGFLHEMGHQLGLIDLYRLNLESGQNKVNGQMFRIGDFLMSSCGEELSQHSARALDSWHGHRRGYYGQYLYDLPDTIVIKLVDDQIKTVANAPVRIYQKIQPAEGGEQIWPTQKFEGTTDELGLYELPNVKIDPRCAVATAVSRPLKPNPWGHVAAVGYSGLFLIEVPRDSGRALYAWLPITEANLAYWSGRRDRTVITLQVRPIEKQGPPA